MFSVSRHLTNLQMYKLEQSLIHVIMSHSMDGMSYPVVADASSQVLIFWLHGNGFGDKKRTLVRNVQSIGNSDSPRISSTS
jgi:hypothetical protein